MIASTGVRRRRRRRRCARGLFDPRGDQFDVGAGQRGVVVVGHQHPLAAERVARRQLAPQRRVADLAARGAAAEPLGRPHAGWGAVEAERRTTLLQPVDQAAVGAPGRREEPEEAPLALGYGAVGLGQHPRRGALEHGERADLLGDLRDELDRAGAGADRRRRACRPGRSRGPTAPSGRPCRRTVRCRAARGCSAGAMRRRRPPRTRPGTPPALVRKLHRAASASQLGAGHLGAEADVRRAARTCRPARAGSPRISGCVGEQPRTIPGSARRSTSTGATGCRRRSRGSCCLARCRRRPIRLLQDDEVVAAFFAQRDTPCRARRTRSR